VDSGLFGQTIYLDPVNTAQSISYYLKIRKKCHLVICLSHLGFDYKEDMMSDIRLASLTENIDLIIGGHTHTFLDEPVKIKTKKGKFVSVTQAGWAGLRLGRIDYLFEKSTGVKLNEVSTIKNLNKSSEN
jgi:5'-nucleotidase